jgi:hypothetical protein
LSTTATSGSGQGTYAITVSGAVSPNYDIKQENGILSISTKLFPVITWNNPSDIVYGTALSTNQLNARADVAGTFTYSSGMGETLKAGANQTLKATFTPADPLAYAEVSASVAINVRKAPLTIIAADRFMIVGSELPVLRPSYSAFVNEETEDKLTAKPKLSTTATSASGVGTYTIVISGAAAPNYEITFVNGTLTITDNP